MNTRQLRITTPAPSSFEEAELEKVRLGRQDLSEAIRNVEKYRELREAAINRLLSGR